jgi:hypothetical protein
VQQLPLRQYSESTAKWSKVSVPIYLKIYVFDILNPTEFSLGNQRPHLKERGPYTFYETREKEIVGWDNETDTIEYHDLKTFYFDQSLSDGHLDDEVSVINAPLVVSISVSLTFTIPRIPPLYFVRNLEF